jgi:hypothetical protein
LSDPRQRPTRGTGNRGNAYDNKGEYDRAIADFTEAANRCKTAATDRAVLAATHIRRGQGVGPGQAPRTITVCRASHPACDCAVERAKLLTDVLHR